MNIGCSRAAEVGAAAAAAHLARLPGIVVAVVFADSSLIIDIQ